MSGCGADDLANEISTNLLTGTDFNINLPDLTGDEFKVPQVSGDVFSDIAHITNDDLTTRVIDGTGTFDYLMTSFKAHLKGEFDNDRITGAEYTKAYTALVEGAMANATQFLLGRDIAHWQAINAQIQAQAGQVALVTARVLLETEKTKLALLYFNAKSAEAEYALNKMRLSTESIQYCIAKYNLENMLPQQKEMLLKQIDHQVAETLGQNKQNTILDGEIDMIDLKNDMLTKQIVGVQNQNSYVAKQTEQLTAEIDLYPKKALLLQAQVDLATGEVDMLPAKELMIREQAESQRAQTLDTRSDGTPVTGTMGKQQALYDQQITSYKRDAEVKAAKIFSDAWITMKTIDEGLLPPTGFQNVNLDQILATLKTANNL